MRTRALLRLLDANANRALEGIRVAEEIVRFHWQDAAAFRRLRALRHGVARAVRRLPVTPAELTGARDSRRDVGRAAVGSRVASIEQLLLINLQRAKEALRTLEECARLLAPRQAGAFQRLRFLTYEVERDLLCRLAALRHPRRRRRRA